MAFMTEMSVLQVLHAPLIVLFFTPTHGQYTRRDDDPRKIFGELQDQDRSAVRDHAPWTVTPVLTDTLRKQSTGGK